MKKAEYKDLYTSNMVKVGQLVIGEVVKIDDRCIYLDINTFTEGKMYLDHYTLDRNVQSFDGLVKLHDKLECEVTKITSNKDDEHEILLSRLNLKKREAFNKFASETPASIEVKVARKVNKGFICVSSGIDFFLPEREADAVNVGDMFEVKILNVDPERGSVLVSKRAFERDQYTSAKQAELESIKKDDVLIGEISNIENYGVFVKFKYNNGLIRLREIDHVFVNNPKTLFNVGDKIEVKVLSNENGKIDLSRKALIKSPFDTYAESNKVSDVVKCKVIQKLPFGVVCELADNVNGLLHTSEFSWNPNDNLMASLKIGDILDLAIIKIDEKKRNIGLSRKALIDNPWSRVDARIGDLVDAKIKEVNSKGITVEALGVDGFIPTSEVVLDKDKKSSKIEDFYNIDDVIKAIVTEVDPKRWVLVLSLKKYQKQLDEKNFEEYIKKQNEEETNTTLGDLFEDVLKK